MVDPEGILERGGPLAQALPPALVILPDPERRITREPALLGRSALGRLVGSARDSGFAVVHCAPGTVGEPSEAEPLATGDPVDRPALIVYEGSLVHPRLLDLMVAHPLEDDEAYTLFDAAGRPAATFVGHLSAVPTILPITEELPWPEELSASDVVRMVYPEDISRAEDLVLRSHAVLVPDGSRWRSEVELPSLRLMAGSGRPLPQLELVAVLAATASLPLALLSSYFGLVLAAAALLVGVHMSALLPWVVAVRSGSPPHGRVVKERLTAAVRPLGQAAFMAGLTYAIVAETDRSGVAALVLLIAGAAAVLLCLFQARLLLRGRPADVFALPDAHEVASRLGMRWPSTLDGSPILEIVAFLAALSGWAEFPWSVLAAGAVARLWRWFGGAPLSHEPVAAGDAGAPPG